MPRKAIENNENVSHKTRWSASRVGTFDTCPLKYKLHYVEKWDPSFKVNTEAADKGTVFHETVEQYTTGRNPDEMWAIIESKCKEYNIDIHKYDYASAMQKFYAFWEYFIVPKEKEGGWQILKEDEITGEINGEPFVGYLDLLCVNEEKKLIEIYDYKSGKTPSTSSYKNQQVLYAYLEGLKRGWSYKEIAEHVTLNLFFPLYPSLKDLNIKDNMLRCIKEIKFDENTVKEVIEDYFKKNIEQIHLTDWTSNVEGKFSYACNWCQYCGSKAQENGFSGCSKSIDLGMKTPENAIYNKRIYG